MLGLTPKQQVMWEAVKTPPEPPCDCQLCERRHGECAEFTASNNPNRTYNREYCHWFKEEEVET